MSSCRRSPVRPRPLPCSVGALPTTEYWKIGIYFALLMLIYLLFSLPMSYIRHSRVDYTAAEELKWVVLRSLLHEGQQPDGAMALRCRVVELALVNGRWQPARLKPTFVPLHSTASGTEPKAEPSAALQSTVRAGSRGDSLPLPARSGTAAAPAEARAAQLTGRQQAQHARLRGGVAPLPPMDEADEASALH